MVDNIYPSNKAPDNSIGLISDGHRANRARFADIFKNGYQWTKKRLPTPGTRNYAFDTLGLVEFTPIGPSIYVRNEPMVVQHPQLYVGGQQVTTTGFGGLAAGQVINQPLIDPYSGTVGGV